MVTIKDLEIEFNKHDLEHNYTSFSEKDQNFDNEFLDDLIKLENKSILGIDIYQYSKFKEPGQNFNPVIFKLILNITNQNIVKYDYFLFQKYIKNSTLQLDFIDSGDGGFFIFDNPLLSLAYAIHFQEVLTNYNTYHLYRKFRMNVGEISLRYSITYDSIFKLDDNYYGPAIINNARILSQDKLNRCLFDQNTHDWFLKYFNSIEQLSYITDKDLNRIEVFKDYDYSKVLGIKHSVLSKNGQDGVQTYGIKSIYSQKIGTIKSKSQYLSIYNLQISFIYSIVDEENEKYQNITSTLGNLNTSGIIVE
ncbi:hypothetical protein AB3N58_10520 [Leptospira sp. WS60.C2]